MYVLVSYFRIFPYYKVLKIFSPFFSPRSCIFLFKFISTIHLGRIFCVMWDKHQDSLLFHMTLQLIQYLLLIISFVVVVPCYVCHNSSKYVSGGLLLDSVQLHWTGFLQLQQKHTIQLL